MGYNTIEQITVKRALYTARMSRPGENTTLVEHLFDSDVLVLSSGDMAGVLLDPLDAFQVSRSFIVVVLQWNLPRSSKLGCRLSTRSATSWGLKTSQLAPHRQVLMLP